MAKWSLGTDKPEGRQNGVMEKPTGQGVDPDGKVGGINDRAKTAKIGKWQKC